MSLKLEMIFEVLQIVHIITKTPHKLAAYLKLQHLRSVLDKNLPKESVFCKKGAIEYFGRPLLNIFNSDNST